MDDKEYRHFLEYLFNKYIKGRISIFPSEKIFMMHHMEMDSHFSDLKWAAGTINYISSYCKYDEHIYKHFRHEHLQEVVNRIRWGLSHSEGLMKETGYLDALDAGYEEIISGLRTEHIPEIEQQILSEMGASDPKLELEGIVYLIKARQEKYSNRETSVSKRLEFAIEEVDKAAENFEKLNTDDEEGNNTKGKKKKSRRWFKGFGQIAQGAALSIGDVLLACNILNLPVSQETKTWGSILSVTTGVGHIFNGIGDLRGE